MTIETFKQAQEIRALIDKINKLNLMNNNISSLEIDEITATNAELVTCEFYPENDIDGMGLIFQTKIRMALLEMKEIYEKRLIELQEQFDNL